MALDAYEFFDQLNENLKTEHKRIIRSEDGRPLFLVGISSKEWAETNLKERSVIELNDSLNAAILNEDYEIAAKLRDEIKARE